MERSADRMFFYFIHYRFGNVRGSFIAAWSETRPVVEVDDADVALRRDNAVSAVDLDVENFRCFLTDAFELVDVEMQSL